MRGRFVTRDQLIEQAINIACYVLLKYESFEDFKKYPGLSKMINEGRCPYDHPAFQAAYAALCQAYDTKNQYFPD